MKNAFYVLGLMCAFMFAPMSSANAAITGMQACTEYSAKFSPMKALPCNCIAANLASRPYYLTEYMYALGVSASAAAVVEKKYNKNTLQPTLWRQNALGTINYLISKCSGAK